MKNLYLILSLILISTATTVAVDLESSPPTVCIIGSGIGGTSVAHFLRNYSSSVIGKIRIFERDVYVGGRTATVTLAGETFEAGASILHPKNYHTLNYTKFLYLSVRRPPSAESDSGFGIWNGREFVFKTLSFNSDLPIIKRLVSFANSVLIFFRYGFSLFSLNKFVDNTVDNFLKYYEGFESRPVFETVEEMLKWSGLYNLTRRTLQEELLDLRFSPRIIEELITVITRINYGQSISISGLAGAVSLAGSDSGVWSVEGGNWQLAAGLINYSNIEMHLDEEVESVSSIEQKYQLNTTKGKSYQCEITVVATPLDEVNIQFLPRISIPERKLQHTYTTFKLKKSLFVFSLLFLIPFFHGGITTAIAATNQDFSESWGYVEVRPKAHMFWWYYRSSYRVEDPNKPWPIILWLQGGPGASGVGIGNFEEIGPLDTNLKPRNSTWLRKADLLFVDNPVGTGYSFVEDKKLFVKTDVEAATDLTTLLIEIFNKNQSLQQSPLYIVAESYGGKYAVTLALSALKAIQSGKLKLKLGGVALGDTWISPEDFVLSWGPLLKDVSRIDRNGLQKSNSLAKKIKQQIDAGQFGAATESWGTLESIISESSNSVDFYNFMLDSGMDPVALTSSELSQSIGMKRYSKYLQLSRITPGSDGDIDDLMNGVIRKKLKIIPKNVSWGGQAGSVFDALNDDFMKPRINEVDELLAKGVNVTVYNGQLDLICATKGTEAWVEKLKWEGLKTFLNMERNPIYCGGDKSTKAFTKSYKNLHFYWILGAGHFVPVDQPCVALDMIASITQSPAVSKK